MQIDVHIHHHDESETTRLLRALLKQGEKIMSQISDITDELNGVKATLQEIGGDVDALQVTIVTLQAQIANMPASSELDALKVVADDVAAQASGIAAKVPAPTT